MTGVLTARLLGPAGRGDFAMIQMYGTLAGAFCASGLSASVIYLSNNDRDKIPEVLVGAAVSGVVIGLLAGLVALLVISIGLKNQSIDIRAGAVIYLAYIPLVMCTSLFLASLQAELKIASWNGTRVLVSVLWLIPLLAVLFYFDVSAKGLAITYLCFLSTYVGCFIWICVRKYGRAFSYSLDTARAILKYSLPTNFAFILNQSNVRLDLILIAGVGSSLEMGLYVIALAYASLQSGILSSVLQLILPKISSISGLEERVAFSIGLSRMAVAASAIVGIVLASLSSVLIPLLFGKGYRESISLAIILLGASSVSFANAVLADCLRGVGLPKRPLVAEATSFLVIGLFLLPSYWQYGLHGVALVAVLGGTVSFICLSRYVSQDMNVPYSRFLLIKRSDVAFVTGRMRNLWQDPGG